ncbi:hypothetical protein [Scytonema sp. HK-05]|uniref:hypothetical protein n=1 Tax=Scytonema sp. HK-05 TaxID=1137095 RepID=UPI0011614A86|nr:hypothetical protein [Scytonema sp. HK-05]
MTSLFAVAFLGTLPAIAQFAEVLEIGDLGQVRNDFEAYSANLRNYLTDYNNSSKTFQPVEGQAQLSITNNSGELNIPNPVAASDSIRDSIVQYSTSDKFETNPAIYGSILSNEINRYIIRGSAETLLGTDGQIRLKNKLEATQNIVRKADESFREAKAKNAGIEGLINNIVDSTSNSTPLGGGQALTQRLVELQLKSIEIEKDQSKLMAEMLGRSIQSQNDLQYTNLNLANISQQNEDSNRARRVETAAEVARLLRVTSQTDLFRKSSAAPSLESPPPDSENNPPNSENSPPPVLEPGQ